MGSHEHEPGDARRFAYREPARSPEGAARHAARVAALLLAACGSPANTVDAQTDAVADAAIDTATDAPIGWESVQEVSNDGSVIIENVTYRSGSLRIKGKVCRPVGAGRYKVAVYNHGGFDGLSIDTLATDQRCHDAAEFGYVWIASSYRGEDGSDGQLEVCLGEVDDVLAMLQIALAQDYADPTRVIMYGGSHGGCITLRAIQKSAPVQAAVAIYPPTDLARLHASWTARIAANDPAKSTLQALMAKLEAGAGGTPATVPAAYEARSPEHFVADTPASVPLLITHGVADQIVPITESCSFVASLQPGTTGNLHVDTSNAIVAAAPSACSGLAFTTTSPRSSWSGDRYFFAYEGLDHVEAGTEFMYLEQDLAEFVMRKVP